MTGKELKFPKGFYWGAATSSHQVEGGTRNDWTEWETSEKRMRSLERSGLIKKYGRENFISGRATDHYHRFKDDFKLAKDLGHNATRFSLEWSRIEPKEGQFDKQELEHYRDVIRAARANGLEPFVTLWHYTLPLWVRDIGGWENKETIHYFARLAGKAAEALGENVRFWITINEPQVFASEAYLVGRRPPQKQSLSAYLRVLRHLALAHEAACAAVKRSSSGAMVGIASNQMHFDARRFDPAGWIATAIANWWWNDRFLKRVVRTSDIIGVNHYFHVWTGLWPDRHSYPLSDMEWQLRPASIYSVLMRLKRFRKPIYVTENGLADAQDGLRPWFIAETLKYVHRAISEGADVRGYLHWAFMDNFEWHDGFRPRFGLVAVDYKTLERTPRPSALTYREICRRNCLDEAEAAPTKRTE